MVEEQEEKAPLLLNVFIQTVIDRVPCCYRTDIEDMQIYDLPVKCNLKKRAGNDFYMTDIYYDKGE